MTHSITERDPRQTLASLAPTDSRMRDAGRGFVARVLGAVRPLALVGLLAASSAMVTGCATSGTTEPTAEDSKAAAAAAEKAEWLSAKAVVDGVFEALQQRDEAAFKALLSEARRADYSRSYYDLWVRETDEGSGHQAQAFEKGHTAEVARVIVSFREGSHTERVAVRLVKEDGSWRWDER